MPARATWKGTLRLSLITIPIRVFPSTSEHSDVSFRQLHRTCKTPIQLKKWCPHHDIELTAKDIVKGYESSKGRYVVVEEEEIASIRPESTRVIEISHVVDVSTVDPIYIERSYYLAPENKTAGSPFAVVREALEGKAGVGRLALHGREYLVAILPRKDSLLMYTLRTAGEVRQMKAIDELEFAHAKVKPEEVKLARQVLNSFESEADLSTFTDNYQQALREMLASKTETEPVAVEKGKPTKVVNLMDALRQSLDKVSKEKKRPAKARARKTARVVRHPSSKARRAS